MRRLLVFILILGVLGEAEARRKRRIVGGRRITRRAVRIAPRKVESQRPAPPGYEEPREGKGSGYYRGRAFSIFGGETLRQGQEAISVGMPWPGFFFEYTYGSSSTFNVGFRGEINYGPSFGYFGILFNMPLTVPMRIHLARARIVNVALRPEPGLIFGAQTGIFFFGFVTKIGVDLDIRVHEIVTILTGMHLPLHFTIWFHRYRDDPIFRVFIPFPFSLGVEVNLLRNFNLFFLQKIGPSIGIEEGGAGVYIYFHIHLGIEYLF